MFRVDETVVIRGLSRITSFAEDDNWKPPRNLATTWW